MPTSIEERKVILQEFASILSELGNAIQESISIEEPGAFEANEIAELLGMSISLIVSATLRTAMGCGVNPKHFIKNCIHDPE